MNKSKLYLISNLLKIVKPLFPIMIITIVMGVIGFIASIGIPVLGAISLLVYLEELPIKYETIFYTAVAFAILRGILRYAEQYSGHYIAFRVLAIIRDKVFTVLRKLSPAKLEGKDKGDLIALITTDIELLEVFFAHTIAPVCIAFLMGLIILFFMFQYSVFATVVLLIGYLITSLVIPKIVSNLGSKKGREFRDGFANLSSYVLESLKGIKESIQYDDTKKRMEQMQDMTKDLEDKNEDLKKYEELSKALSDLTVICTAVIIFVYMLYKRQLEMTPLETVIIPTTLALSSFGPFIALSNLSNNLLQTLSSGYRVLSLLEEQPQVVENTSGDFARYGDTIFENVDFSYQDKKILENLSINFSKNKSIGILGKSGSGKSTILKLIMRFWDVNGGKVSIDNQNVKNLNTNSLRNIQSYVTQETVLFSGTIAENIKIAKEDASLEEIIIASKKASIHDFIDKLPQKYETQIGEAIGQISAGEKQRISMARAFLHNSPILLLDEPTSNLDSLNEAVILKTIKDESKNKTVILVSHRKSSLLAMQEIYSMEKQDYL